MLNSICYILFERRQSIKADGTESKTPRYVAMSKAGYFRPLLQSMMSKKSGEIVLYYQRNDKCNPNSTAETRLQCMGAINFSSVYFVKSKAGEPFIGYGEPPRSKMLKGNKQNPFYDNREDGYLFIISPDMKTIEILVIPQGRLLVCGYAEKLANGLFDEALNELRKSASTELDLPI
jgi:hypothetical protein